MALSLETQTASMTNAVMSRATRGQPEPAIGMGATILGWTDRYAGTIIEIEGGIVAVQEDRAIRTDRNGMSECQDYSYEANPAGSISRFRYRNEAWEQVERNARTGRWKLRQGYGLVIGKRVHYRDFSF